jgi:hypothetical protein
VLPVAPRAFAEIAFAVRCVDGDAIERASEPETLAILDLPVPLITIAATQASAPAKLGRALILLDSAANRRIKRPALAEFSPGAGGVP